MTIDIKLTSLEEITKYLNLHSGSTEDIKTKITSIGYYLGEELLAAVSFCYPKNILDREEYTTELLSFHASIKENFDQSLAFKSLVEYFIEKFDPSDLLYNMNNSVKENSNTLIIESLITLGFTQDFEKNRLTWVNSSHTHYTYKITSPESNKYYFGVRTVKIPNASIKDCLNDDYYGSGSKLNKNNKFSNWRKKHEHSLVKEIIEVYSNKAVAYKAEESLIGNLWKTDSNCLNSISGGRAAFIKNNKDSVKFKAIECPKHGRTTHTIKGNCRKCSSSKIFNIKECLIHGETKFRGEKCAKCLTSNLIESKDCALHGISTYIGSICLKCSFGDSISLKKCVVHGVSKHSGNNCFKCFISKTIRIGFCETHGETNFRVDNCIKCQVQSKVSLKNCSIHGKTKHQGDTCAKCSIPSSKIKNCEVHGEALHIGSVCANCRSEVGVSVNSCLIHGEVKFIGDKCRVCINNASVNILECEHHGFVKHQGNKCSTCTSQRVAHKRFHQEKSKAGCFLCK